ncbi:hypothetical protein D3C72_1911070 [compost metagenome]
MPGETTERPVPGEAAERNEFAHRHSVGRGRELRHIGNLAREGASRPVAEFLALQQDAATLHRKLARKDLEQRALSRSIRADQPIDLAGFQREIDPRQDALPTDGIADIGKGKQR